MHLCWMETEAQKGQGARLESEHGGTCRVSRHLWLSSFGGGQDFLSERSSWCSSWGSSWEEQAEAAHPLSVFQGVGGGVGNHAQQEGACAGLGSWVHHLPPAPRTGWRSSPMGVYRLAGCFQSETTVVLYYASMSLVLSLCCGSLGSQMHPARPTCQSARPLPQHVLPGQWAHCITFLGPSPPPMDTAPAAWIPSDQNTFSAPASTTLPSITSQNLAGRLFRAVPPTGPIPSELWPNRAALVLVSGPELASLFAHTFVLPQPCSPHHPLSSPWGPSLLQGPSAPECLFRARFPRALQLGALACGIDLLS